MSILNTFFILFKSNSEDVIKGNKAIEKSTKETEQSLKNTNEEAQKLGQNFLKAVESAASLTAAFAAFQTLKNAADKVNDLNVAIGNISQTTRQTAQNLKVMSQAAKEAGGDLNTALGDYERMSLDARSRGITNFNFVKQMQVDRAAMRGMSENGKLDYLQKVRGYQDNGNIRMLMSDDATFKAYVQSGLNSMGNTSQSDIDTALANRQADEQLKGANSNFSNTMNNVFSPIGRAWNSLWAKGVNSIARSETATAMTAGGYVAGSAGAAAGGTALAGSLLSGGAVGGAVAGALPVVVVGGAAIGVGAAGGSVIMDAVGPAIQRGIENYYNNQNAPRGLRNNNPGNIEFNSSNNWQGQTGTDGRFAKFATPEHGIRALSVLLRNYGMNTIGGIVPRYAPGFENNTGAYISAMEKSTGFGRNERLNLNDPDVMKKIIKGIIKHETGRGDAYSDDTIMSGIAMAQKSLGTVSDFKGFGGSSGGGSVTIEKIEINTAATDARGIASDLRQELNSQLGYVAGNFDDGVQR